MKIAVVTAVTILIAQFLLHNTMKMLCTTENKICSSANYKGKVIPQIGGIVFIPILLVAILLLLLLGLEDYYVYMRYLALVMSMGFVGVVDDLVGDIRTKGFVNHIKSILKGTMTTGFLKAFIGFMVSCIISIGTTSTYIEFIVNVLIISLFANTINLFDLRPGRAVKVFLIISLILLASAIGRLTEAAPIIILNLAALLYIRYDLKEICMLGDTGANILGITLGYYSALLMGINSKITLLALLVLMNAMSERLSISKIIKSSRMLSYLDSIGRGREETDDKYSKSTGNGNHL